MNKLSNPVVAIFGTLHLKDGTKLEFRGGRKTVLVYYVTGGTDEFSVSGALVMVRQLGLHEKPIHVGNMITVAMMNKGDSDMEPDNKYQYDMLELDSFGKVRAFFNTFCEARPVFPPQEVAEA